MRKKTGNIFITAAATITAAAVILSTYLQKQTT